MILRFSGILRTKAQALRYAKELAALHQVTIHVFPVPKGTVAHDYGYRYGTCHDDELKGYLVRGARIIASVKP